MRLSIIPILLLVVPISEIAVFILIGGQIGVFPTLVMIFVTAILGTFFLRQQGLGILQRLQNEQKAGRLPGRELVHGAMIMIAGVLLLTPGFVTDSIGFLLFFPPFRDLAWNFIKSRISVVNFGGGLGGGPNGGMGGFHSTDRHPNYPKEPYVDLNEDEYTSEPNPDSPWGDGGKNEEHKTSKTNQVSDQYKRK
ncbi:FxsA family protein [Lentilitoribacter sp. Alg239-R112]|uniref:FxsA family protein n=1 Tax=Lentilitoribacter sp. Alg239-R112 TaxID=2305987 RepID=UPI0013A70060|nr:FxsA family protein [Lentilitoribacter sp. Alg239-R112]